MIIFKDKQYKKVVNIINRCMTGEDIDKYNITIAGRRKLAYDFDNTIRPVIITGTCKMYTKYFTSIKEVTIYPSSILLLCKQNNISGSDIESITILVIKYMLKSLYNNMSPENSFNEALNHLPNRNPTLNLNYNRTKY